MRKRCHAMRSTFNVSGRLPPGLCRVRWAVAALRLGGRALPARRPGPRQRGVSGVAESSSRRRRRRPTSYLATNFGLIFTADGARSWRWSCEQAENSFASLYQLGPGPKYRLYALSSVGIAYSDNRGCTWTVSKGFAGLTVLDYFPDPTNPNRVLAIASVSTDGGLMYEVIQSSDGGATFGPVLYRAASTDNLTGVEIAKSSPSTIYLSLTSGTLFSPKLVRSTDGGANWRVYDLAPSLAPKTNSVRIIAIDPTDPNKVYLRVRSSDDAVAVTKFDAAGEAATSTPLTFAAGILSAFVRLDNGHLLAGGVVGLAPAEYLSTDGGASFQSLPHPPSLRALSARGNTVYGVADNQVDGYAIGTSVDEGVTWQPLLRYDQITAIDTCLKQTCQDDCQMRADIGQWSPDFCAATAPDPSGGAGGTVGIGATAGAGGGAGSSGAGGTSGGSAGSSGGCHCALGSREGGAAGAALSALALAVATTVTARRRRRQSRAERTG